MNSQNPIANNTQSYFEWLINHLKQNYNITIPLMGNTKNRGLYLNRELYRLKHSLLIVTNEEEDIPHKVDIFAFTDNEIDKPSVDEEKDEESNDNNQQQKNNHNKKKPKYVRKAINVRTGETVQIKLFPMHSKKSFPEKISEKEIDKILYHWNVIRGIRYNRELLIPKVFHSFVAQDKSGYHVRYFVIQDRDQFKRLHEFALSKSVALDSIRDAYVDLLAKYIRLKRSGHSITEISKEDILVTGESKILFADAMRIYKTNKISFLGKIEFQYDFEQLAVLMNNMLMLKLGSECQSAGISDASKLKYMQKYVYQTLLKVITEAARSVDETDLLKAKMTLLFEKIKNVQAEINPSLLDEKPACEVSNEVFERLKTLQLKVAKHYLEKNPQFKTLQDIKKSIQKFDINSTVLIGQNYQKIRMMLSDDVRSVLDPIGALLDDENKFHYLGIHTEDDLFDYLSKQQKVVSNRFVGQEIKILIDEWNAAKQNILDMN